MLRYALTVRAGLSPQRRRDRLSRPQLAGVQITQIQAPCVSTEIQPMSAQIGGTARFANVEAHYGE